MTIRHAYRISPVQRRSLRKSLRKKRKEANRKMRHETLEARQLLAADVFPILVGVQPNDGELLQNGDVRNQSIRSLTLNFANVVDPNDLIDPETLLEGIVIRRGGPDRVIGTMDDVVVVGPGGNFEGFIGMGDAPNEVIIRFGDALPDDVYRLEITSALTDLEGESAQETVIEFELNLGPQVQAVVPQPVTRNPTTGNLEIARDTIHVYFNNDELDRDLATDPDFYQLSFQRGDSNGNLGFNNGEQVFYPREVIYDADLDMAILKFSEAIDQLAGTGNSNEAASIFRLQIGVRGIASKDSRILDLIDEAVGSSFNNAYDLGSFTGNLYTGEGAEDYQNANLFTGNHEFVITRGAFTDTNNDGQIDVNGLRFVINDGLGQTRTFELSNSGSVASGNVLIDISVSSPLLISAAAATGEPIGSPAVLAEAIREAIMAELGNVDVLPVFRQDGSQVLDRMQLRGLNGNRPEMRVEGSTSGMIVDRSQAIVIRSQIRSETDYNLRWPGSNYEPGHRENNIPGENHVGPNSADTSNGPATFTFNFPDIYGIDPASPTQEPLQNQITEAQKERTREILEIYGRYAGLQFIELPSSGSSALQIVTGDMRALDPTIPVGPGGVAGLASNGMAIMDIADFQDTQDDRLGGPWQWTAFHEIGHLLGLRHTYELPPGTNMGDEGELAFGQMTERLLPGNHDITHLRHLYRPDSFDIDLYRFEVTETGRFTAEIMAERLADSSHLDAVLTLYREAGDGTREVIARNDNYFSNDSFLEMELEIGTYYIGVSASGNNVYDPAIEDSGMGGVSEGMYQLQLRFNPNVADAIRDLGSQQQRPSSLVIRGTGEDFQDGQTFTLRDINGISRTFEIDIVSSLDDPADVSNPAHVPVQILTSSLQSEIVQQILAAINGVEALSIEATSVGNRVDLNNLAINNPITLGPGIISSQSILISAGAAESAALDGNLDGTPGGAYNFWFRAEASADRDGNDASLHIDDFSSVSPGETLTVTANASNGVGYTVLVEFLGPGHLTPVNTSGGTLRVVTVNLSDITRPEGDPISRGEKLATAVANAINSGVATIRAGLSPAVRLNLTASAGGRQIAVGFNNGMSTTGTGLSIINNVTNSARTVFVDNTYVPPQGVTPDGSLLNPFTTISAAINYTRNRTNNLNIVGDVIRVIGLQSNNDDPDTLLDNRAYLIGRDPITAAPLRDGTNITIPQGVTMMIDEGAILKFYNAGIIVGSTSVTEDRSFSALQILGIPERYTPELDEDGEFRTDEDGNVIGQDTERLNRRVVLTSYNEEGIGDASNNLDNPSAGNWGGIFYGNNVDRDQEWGTFEDRGIFLSIVNGADIRYAGGEVEIDGNGVALAPIYLDGARPTINFNIMTRNAGAAISADPNSFEESNYQMFEGSAATFTPDIERIGPDIFGNFIVDNSINGMLIRVRTQAGSAREALTVSARFDDTDIVHVLQDTLDIKGNPGGPASDNQGVLKVHSLPSIAAGSSMTFTGEHPVTTAPVVLTITYQYNGAGQPLQSATMAGNNRNVTVNLDALPIKTEVVLAELIADIINQTAINVNAEAALGMVRFSRAITPGGSALASAAFDFGRALESRLNAGLRIDPNIVVKSNAARFNVQFGANFTAEGTPGSPVVFTSIRDDRYGFGGTFDTNNDGDSTAPAAGDWSGFYFAHTSTGSLDNIVFAYGGGASSISGGLAHFNAVEIHQATVRITDSVFEYNANGLGPNDGVDRSNHMTNSDGVIFVRNSQPVIVGNNIRHNDAAAINADISSLNHELVVDWGRSTGGADVKPGMADNRGILVRNNLLTDNNINGMVVRGGTLTTQSVWDDTDIAHVVFNTIYAPDFHTYGGIRMQSSATQSLVVKLLGQNAGFTATGRPLDINDRIGGMLHVVGQPGRPVIFTSLHDDSVGAGFDQFGAPQTDTNNNGGATTPQPGDWRGLVIDEYAHDRNVAVIVESEANNLAGAGTNGTPQTAQHLGSLAPREFAADDNRRLGFEVHGFLSSPVDVDVYSFIGVPGTEIWIDMDRTTHNLDAVIELIDTDGNVLARSVDSGDTWDYNWLNPNDPNLYNVPGLNGQVNSLRKSGFYDEDFWTTNPRDPGMRLILPGTPGSAPRTYHVRIRSNSDNLGNDNSNLAGGITYGVYQFQIRLREQDEFAGSSIRFADVRYAINGISVFGQPGHSPLLGESAESPNANNNVIQNAQYLGNVFNSNRATLGVAGNIDGKNDVDWFKLDLNYDSIQAIGGVSAETEYASIIFDMDYAAGTGRVNPVVSIYNANGQLIFTGQGSNVNDDLTHPQTPGNPGNADMTRGSTGNGDPFLGTIQLPAGTPANPIHYHVAISSQAQTPVQMDQFTKANASNPLTRLEPIDSIHRIVEDHINSGFYSTALPPDSTSILRNDSRKEFHLNDFTMFVVRPDGAQTSRLYAVNPFTGAVEANVGSFGYSVRDLIQHPDGTLYAYNVDTAPGAFRPNDANSGKFIQIDTGNGQATFLRDDGIGTYWQPGTPDPVLTNLTDGGNKNSGVGFGYQFEATSIYNTGGAQSIRTYAIGSRGDVSPATSIFDPTSQFTNVVFRMDASDTDGNGRPIGEANSTSNFKAAMGNVANTDQFQAVVGRIETSIGDGDSVNAIQAFDATIFDMNGLTQAFLRDGMTFTVDPDGEGNILHTFELDFGADILFSLNPTAGNYIEHGKSFKLSGAENQTVVFQTGKVLTFDNFNSANLTASHQSAITITDTQGIARTFRLNVDNAGISGGIAVNVDSNALEGEVVTALVNAINSSAALGVTATVQNGRVTLEGDSNLVLQPVGGFTFGGMQTFGDYNLSTGAGQIVVNVEETFTSEEVVAAIFEAFDSANTSITASARGGRVSFLDLVTPGQQVGFSGNLTDNMSVASINQTVSAEPGVDGGNIRISIGAGFTAAEVGDAIVKAANSEGVVATNTLSKAVIDFGPEAVTDVGDTPFENGQVGAGGYITGVTQVGNLLYAVTNTGGLLSFNPNNVNPTGNIPITIIDTVNDLSGIQFTSLTSGPSSTANKGGIVGNTQYGNILFGTSVQGDIYAFDTAGEFQYLFHGAREKISTGLFGIQGVEFGTLNRNLWQTSTTRGDDAGHGLSIPVTNTRNASNGGASMHFGNEANAFPANAGNSQWGNATKGDYNFPGSAHGTVISDPFSLHGYDRADLPTLYFNYFLATDGQDYVPQGGNDIPATDAFRVFAAGDDGVWHVLATNNGFRSNDNGPNPDDEFDSKGNASKIAVPESLRQLAQNGTEGVQELFDNTGTWRQARVDLSAFAGLENIRLRFDFSTGGSVNLGGVSSTQGGQQVYMDTEEIRFLDGRRLADGEVFSITDRFTGLVYTFELDKGQSFEFATGAQIQPNSTFTLTGSATFTSQTFQFVRNASDADPGNHPIVYNWADSAEIIAQRVRLAISANMIDPVDIIVYSDAANRFNIKGIEDVSATTPPAGGAPVVPGMIVYGANGNNQLGQFHRIIEFDASTSAIDLATEAQMIIHDEMVSKAVAQGYEIFNRFDEFIFGHGYSFNVQARNFASPYATIGYNAKLQGDEFGYANQGKMGNPLSNDSNARMRGQNNLHQGVFVDDIIIGFAERGEMVTGSNTNSAFGVNTNLRINENLQGEYQLEVRRGTDYAAINPFTGLYQINRTFDTNDRLVQGHSIMTPSGSEIQNGSRIVVGDGVDAVVFEFFDRDSNSEMSVRGFLGSTARRDYDRLHGIYSIGFSSNDTDADVARLLMNAINDSTGHINRQLITTTQGILGVRAQVNIRSNVTETTRNQVDLSKRTLADDVIVSYAPGSNDSFHLATKTKMGTHPITAGQLDQVLINASIGDNDPLNHWERFADIDVYEFQVQTGQDIELAVNGFAGLVLELYFRAANGTFSQVNLTQSAPAGGYPDVYRLVNANPGRYFAVVSGRAVNGEGEEIPNYQFNPRLNAFKDVNRRVVTLEGDYQLRLRAGTNLDSATVQRSESLNVLSAGGEMRYSNPTATLFSGPSMYPLRPAVDLGNGLVLGSPIYQSSVAGFTFIRYDMEGDQNQERDQGQIILDSNFVSHSKEYGILIDAGERSTGNLPHQGSPRVFASAQNTNRLATGVTVTNNVVHGGGTGAIRYSGDDLGGNNALAAVPFGRIVNNTLYGTGAGDIGIRVDEAAGPTLMNNIIANFGTGISIADATSKANTVITRNLFQGNATNSNTTVGSLAVTIGPNDPLFVDAANANFYLAQGSKAIDAAVDSLDERTAMTQVIEPLGIAPSPILAPNRDITGQLRVPDPQAVSGGGVGGVTFRDIGAYDRADFQGPSGFLLEPRDNDSAGLDLDPANDVVQLVSGPLSRISIQLIDTNGSGIDDNTVSAGSVTLLEFDGTEPDPRTMVLGVDYNFDYDATNNIIRLVPVSGVFREGVLYKILLDNDPESETVIRDIAGNPIRPNKQNGETSYLVQAGGLLNFGDAPESYGTLLEDDGARHIIVPSFHLGESITATTNGQPSQFADASDSDDGIYIRTDMGLDVNDDIIWADFTLRSGVNNEIYITATVPVGASNFGYVDAWVDFNGNGVFDENEQILISAPLNINAIDPLNSPGGMGQKIVLSNIPADAVIGDTFARFRYSSTGGLSPTGVAADGEVEDYLVTIAPGVPNPWHNSSNPIAVDKFDNFTTIRDLNLVITELFNRNYTYGKQGEVIPPGSMMGDFRPGWEPGTVDPAMVPAYLDVNNDRQITGADLTVLVNALLSMGGVQGEPLAGEPGIPSQMESVELISGSVMEAEPETYGSNLSIEEAPAVTESPSQTQLSIAKGSELPGSISTDVFAPNYSEVASRPAYELMGYRLRSEVVSEELSAIDASWGEEELTDSSDDIDRILADVADDLTSTWDRQYAADQEDSDDLEDLLALLSQGENEDDE